MNNLALRRKFEASGASGTFESHFEDVEPNSLALGLDVGLVTTTLRRFGAPSEALGPFTTKIDVRPTPRLIEQAAAYRCLEAICLGERTPYVLEAATATNLCKALALGPAVVRLSVYPDFGCSVRGEYVPKPHDDSNAYLGSHAVVVVAFDPHYPGPDSLSQTPAFRVMNSWGTDWGTRGFTWITQKSLFGEGAPDDNLVTEIHAFDPADPKPCPEPTTNLPFPPDWASASNTGWTREEIPEDCNVCGIPDADNRTAVLARAARKPRWIDVARVAGTRVPIRAPAVPLVPARLRSTVRYYVDGAPAGLLDTAKTGLAFHFVDRTGGSTSSKRTPDPDVGADPTTIGAFVDRAVLEIVNPGHPYLIGEKTIRVLVEVYDPDATEPRAVARYRIRIPKETAPPPK